MILYLSIIDTSEGGRWTAITTTKEKCYADLYSYVQNAWDFPKPIPESHEEAVDTWFGSDEVDDKLTIELVTVNHGQMTNNDKYSRLQAKYNSVATLSFEFYHDKEEEATEEEILEGLLLRLDSVLCQPDGDSLVEACGDWEDTHENPDADPAMYYQYRFKGPNRNSVLIIYQGKSYIRDMKEEDHWFDIPDRNGDDNVSTHCYFDYNTNCWTVFAWKDEDRGDGIYEPTTEIPVKHMDDFPNLDYTDHFRAKLWRT